MSYVLGYSLHNYELFGQRSWMVAFLCAQMSTVTKSGNLGHINQIQKVVLVVLSIILAVIHTMYLLHHQIIQDKD